MCCWAGAAAAAVSLAAGGSQSADRGSLAGVLVCCFPSSSTLVGPHRLLTTLQHSSGAWGGRTSSPPALRASSVCGHFGALRARHRRRFQCTAAKNQGRGHGVASHRCRRGFRRGVSHRRALPGEANPLAVRLHMGYRAWRVQPRLAPPAPMHAAFPPPRRRHSMLPCTMCRNLQLKAACPLPGTAPHQVSCDFNPAVLLAEAVRGKVSAGDFWALFAAQLLGHFSGGPNLQSHCPTMPAHHGHGTYAGASLRLSRPPPPPPLLPTLLPPCPTFACPQAPSSCMSSTCPT